MSLKIWSKSPTSLSEILSGNCTTSSCCILKIVPLKSSTGKCLNIKTKLLLQTFFHAFQPVRVGCRINPQFVFQPQIGDVLTRILFFASLVRSRPSTRHTWRDIVQDDVYTRKCFSDVRGDTVQWPRSVAPVKSHCRQ